MRREGTTIREAAEMWVKEMNAYPYDMIEKLMQADMCDWQEVTVPRIGDRVYVYDQDCGEIVKIKRNEDDEAIYSVKLDNGKTVRRKEGDIEVDRDGLLPMWGTLWSFGDSADDYWLEELGGIQIMSECGFRIYESGEFGYFFGIDGAGYSFYEEHWIPLYKKRGLQWHDPMTESGSFVMTEWRKAELYSALLGCLDKITLNKWELANVLKEIGFSDQEIAFEGLGVIGDAED